MPAITFYPDGRTITVPEGTTVLEAERMAGYSPDSPCGGHGLCGKCRVKIDGSDALACQSVIDKDICVTLSPEASPASSDVSILVSGLSVQTKTDPVKSGDYLAGVDIGTTTMVCYLMDALSGEQVSSASMLNPQFPYGSDVVSRIQSCLNGNEQALTQKVREGVNSLIGEACRKAKGSVSSSQIGAIAFVGNPAMQQLFLGMSVKNLASPPFPKEITHTLTLPAAPYLPSCPDAALLTLPDIAGYVGADTMGCVLSTRMYEQDPMTLMLDIGTNGEMVLGNRKRMVATSTAAGPALEGAGITFGMRGSEGAVDHVAIRDDALVCHVIGEGKAIGLCGSGLIDAVAALLDLGVLNRRGRIGSRYEEVHGERVFYLTEDLYLSQNDIRAVQMAKGAIAAGIEILAGVLKIRQEDISRVLLAGAFGSFITPSSACRIGMIPPSLLPEIKAIGNAAGSGARLCALNRHEFAFTDELSSRIESIELSSQPDFQRIFAKNMMFTA